MATRQVYIVTDEGTVEKHDIDFKWYPGFSRIQKQKSIRDLHKSASSKLNIHDSNLIEISSKSEMSLGIALSAFNLKTRTIYGGLEYSVESAFQSSKVFEKGGPFIENMYTDLLAAKRDPRLKNSGKLLYFRFFGQKFELNPVTTFYDWLYINVLLKNPALCEPIVKFSAFTDIEFNSKKSLNTQAFSVALFVLLKNLKVDMTNFKDHKVFLEKTKKIYAKL